MAHRKFLIHSVSHTFLLVDLTELGPSNEIYPPRASCRPYPLFDSRAGKTSSNIS